MSASADAFERQLIDDAIVLYDHKTDTTRWVLWRHVKTNELSLALVQKGEVVSVNVANILYFCAKVLPRFMRPELDGVKP